MTGKIILSVAAVALLPFFFQPGTTRATEPAPAKEYQGWDQTESRGGTRLIYFHKTAPQPWHSSPGQVAIEYGKPVWKPAYDQQFDSLTMGRRWRLGKNQWTNLDSNFPISVSGTEVEAGYYYLSVERSADDQWALLLFDPIDMAEMEMDAWHVDRRDAPELLRASLQHEKIETKAEELKIEFHLDTKNDKKAELEILFGPHRLTCTVEVLFG